MYIYESIWIRTNVRRGVVNDFGENAGFARVNLQMTVSRALFFWKMATIKPRRIFAASRAIWPHTQKNILFTLNQIVLYTAPHSTSAFPCAGLLLFHHLSTIFSERSVFFSIRSSR